MGAGDFDTMPDNFKEEDMVIAVDGGFAHLMDKRVDLLIGDFDSLSFVPKHPNIIRLPSEKDDTDMLSAVMEGLDSGYREFHIYGGTGGRFSHTIANVQCLVYLAERGAHGFLYGKNEITTAIKNESFCFSDKMRGYVSVFAYTKEAKGVWIKGLKYRLSDALLLNTLPLGVSNEFIKKPAEISVEEGILLIIYPRIMEEGEEQPYSR